MKKAALSALALAAAMSVPTAAFAGSTGKNTITTLMITPQARTTKISVTINSKTAWTTNTLIARALITAHAERQRVTILFDDATRKVKSISIH